MVKENKKNKRWILKIS